MTVTKRRSKTDAEAVQSSGLTIEPGEPAVLYCELQLTQCPRDQVHLRLLCVVGRSDVDTS